MGYFSITIWSGTSTFLDGYLGSNLQMWKCNDFMDCFTSYNIFKTTFFLVKKKWLMFITLPSKLAMLVYVAGLLIWSHGLFIFGTYHTPHMINVFFCSRILGTLICIWNNGRRYSIYCFTILHTAISLSYRCLGHIWMLSRIVDNLHVDRYWV